MPIIELGYLEDPGIMGTQRAVKDLDGHIMYGGDLKGFLSNLWASAKPLVNRILSDDRANQFLKDQASKLIDKGVEEVKAKLNEKGREKLQRLLKGGCVSGSMQYGKGLKMIN